MIVKSIKYSVVLVGCLFSLGCVAKVPQPETKIEAEGVSEIKKVEEKEKDPCEAQLDEVVVKTRKEMKTVIESCQGLRMEVNPMWDMNYDGTVHIRIYDAAGKNIRDEFRKPASSKD